MIWMARDFDPRRGKRFLSFPKLANLLLGPPILLLNWYRVLFRWWNGREVKLTTHLQLVPRLRMCRAIPLLLLYARKKWKFFTWVLLHCFDVEGFYFGNKYLRHR